MGEGGRRGEGKREGEGKEEGRGRGSGKEEEEGRKGKEEGGEGKGKRDGEVKRGGGPDTWRGKRAHLLSSLCSSAHVVLSVLRMLGNLTRVLELNFNWPVVADAFRLKRSRKV